MRSVRKRREPKLLKYRLHRHLAGYRPERSHDVVHASDLRRDARDPAWCERELALMDVLGTERRARFQHTAQAVAFRTSSIGQDVITEWAVEMGVAVGFWRCGDCGQRVGFSKHPGYACPKCGVLAWRYEEARFRSAYSGVSGGIDLIVDLGGPKLRAYEIKTVQPSDFKNLAGPLAEHRWRTNLYLRLVAESRSSVRNLIDVEEASVLYLAKGGYGVKDPNLRRWKLHDGEWSPFLEFSVRRDDAATDAYVERAARLREFREDGGPIPPGVCASIQDARARYCPMVDACFSGEYPAGVWRRGDV